MTPALTVEIGHLPENNSGCCVDLFRADRHKQGYDTFMAKTPWPIDPIDFFWGLLSYSDKFSFYRPWKIEQIQWLVRNRIEIRVRAKTTYEFTSSTYMNSDSLFYHEQCLLLIDIMNEDDAMIYKLTWGGE